MENRVIVALAAFAGLAYFLLRPRTAQAAVYNPQSSGQTYTPQAQASVSPDYVGLFESLLYDYGSVFTAPATQQPVQTPVDYGADYGVTYDYGYTDSGAVDIWEMPTDTPAPYVQPDLWAWPSGTETTTQEPAVDWGYGADWGYTYSEPAVTGAQFSVAVPDQYVNAILDASSKWGVPADTLARLLKQESNWNPQAYSSAGAQGIAQFMPGTASQVSNAIGAFNPFDPLPAINAAGYYLRYCYDVIGSGQWIDAVAGYNWGPGNVINYIRSGRTGFVPTETQKYTLAIVGTTYGTEVLAGIISTVGVRG